MTGARPRRGGTLRLSGPGGLDGLDPVRSPRWPADQLVRLVNRTLFTYQPADDQRSWQAVAPVPDLAAAIPSIYNAGVGASYTNYVVRLRPSVRWDTTPPRPVTAHDVARGLKRMCNPVCGSPALPYFTGTIRGMAEFRDGYAAAMPGTGPVAADLAAYQNSHEIPGVRVLDDETLVFELIRPALDFVDLLALPCAAPAPAEYDAFLPDSPEFHRGMRSNGPYRLSEFAPGGRLRLTRNPVWSNDSDPLHGAYVDAVSVTGGEADLPWGPSGTGGEHGFGLDPYLVLNTRGILADRRIRQAVAYAVDKAGIAAMFAGTAATVRTAGSIIPPGSDGHQDIDPYRTPGDGGDPERSRALLAEAGHPDGVTLTAVHPDTGPDRALAQSYTTDLQKAGFTVRLVGLDQSACRSLLRDPAGTTEWDIAAESWWPHWFHDNGRAFLQPMFQTSASGFTANYGGYSDPDVDRLITLALEAAEEPRRAVEAWREAERRILADAAIVPILFQSPGSGGQHGARVRGAAPVAAFRFAPDLANVWLSE